MPEKEYAIIQYDPYLKPYKNEINLRMEQYEKTKMKILSQSEDISSFANGHLFYGFHKTENGVYYREWAPLADSLYLIGDFNGWNRKSHPLKKISGGNFEIFVPKEDGLTHKSKVKVQVTSGGVVSDRIPLYIKKVIQDKTTNDFCGQYWQPEIPFSWSDRSFSPDTEKLFIYECHVGMAQEKEGVGTYREFTENVLPRIKNAGYNAVQLMAVMEHPYYGSFGYQVSNFFAASSWFGEPEDLKELVDTAHNMRIAVILDVVHSHSVGNFKEGINSFDGTIYQFFHTGKKGDHPAWGTKLFNYGKHEVIHFLLSNLKFWLEEYHFDGFRFDGITSMIYHHHGLGVEFNNYKKYFSTETDLEAITYLQLATDLIKSIKPESIIIAEDMSGMPGMCVPVKDGGIGFDYRLAMGQPDFWINTLKKLTDERWSMGHMWHELTTRRPMEKNIAYCESHDQALVGDKTIIFHLADKEMYWHMDREDQSLIINRAMDLHKLIRFITLSLGGEAYLNFMGNEFGHPEWIDFPRRENGWSFKYAQRKWSLADNGFLRYEFLKNFDREMIVLASEYKFMRAKNLINLWMDENKKVIAFKKGELIFIFNFHPLNSYTDFFLPLNEQAEFNVIFNSDEKRFGGFDRISRDVLYNSSGFDKKTGIMIYTPSRTAIVLKAIKIQLKEV